MNCSWHPAHELLYESNKGKVQIDICWNDPNLFLRRISIYRLRWMGLQSMWEHRPHTKTFCIGAALLSRYCFMIWNINTLLHTLIDDCKHSQCLWLARPLSKHSQFCPRQMKTTHCHLQSLKWCKWASLRPKSPVTRLWYNSLSTLI